LLLIVDLTEFICCVAIDHVDSWVYIFWVVILWVYPSTQLDFGRELIVLHTSTPSMLGKFSVHFTLAGD
jgi:hypothetical protein